jgi:(2R)-3-sulfolactate dehydrogenase (NADP+)
MTARPDPPGPQPTVGQLRRQATELLTAAALPPERAAVTAHILVLADVWGVPSHGLMRLPYYLARLVAGGCRADAELTTVSDTGPVVAFDGGGGLGHWQLWSAAETARERCARYGVAAVSVADSSHCGALGTYVHPTLDAGQIALVFSNGPAVMPPWGGARPVLSTSPIAAGVPTTPDPLVVDLATSTVARGKIAARAQSGEPLPEGWALAPDGTPTTDPQTALRGMLAPLGGAKGYALALLVETLTAGVVGPRPSTEVCDMFDSAHDARRQGISHLLIALDPDALGDGALGDGVLEVLEDGTPGGRTGGERTSDGAGGRGGGGGAGSGAGSGGGGGGAAARLAALSHSVTGSGGRIPGARRTAPDRLDPELPVALAPSTTAALADWTARLSPG